jgi:hypothetical protein
MSLIKFLFHHHSKETKQMAIIGMKIVTKQKRDSECDKQEKNCSESELYINYKEFFLRTLLSIEMLLSALDRSSWSPIC